MYTLILIATTKFMITSFYQKVQFIEIKIKLKIKLIKIKFISYLQYKLTFGILTITLSTLPQPYSADHTLYLKLNYHINVKTK